MTSPFAGTIALLSTLTPPSLSRAWLTSAHPTLPIVATCSSDKAVRIYSLTSFTLLSTITGGHKRSVRTCAWKPNLKGESVLATGSFDASVGIWRRWDGDMNPKSECREEVNLTAGGDNAEEEDDAEEWRFAIVLDGHESEVKSVAWSTGGNFLATCSRDKSVWIWEEVGEDDFETIAVLQEHEGDVKCVAWHPEEELLASGSYDDDIRLWREDVDDWGCVGILRGHESTVWAVEWEGVPLRIAGDTESERTEKQQAWAKRRELAGPRLLSCSDDMTIRIWRRRPKEKGPQQNKLSIIRTGSIEEDWVEEARLPQKHERTIYSVAWSKRSGRIVSTGGDGSIIVYEEKWKPNVEQPRTECNSDAMPDIKNGDGAMETETTQPEKAKASEEDLAATEWVVFTKLDNAHGVFEINHVCWARRADKGRKSGDEEVIVSTGDDGVVKVWTLDIR